MLDQASELRNLVRRATREVALSAGPEPRLLTMIGGRFGVGVTTVAVNLSIALVDQGMRVVLVDADFDRGDVADLCELTDRAGIGDILAARRDIHEVLQRGPGGVMVVPGIWTPNSGELVSQRAQERLLKQIQSLGRHADVVLIDVGSTAAPMVQRFWFAAHDILLVTTPDPASVMDCYATVKTLLGHGADPETIRLVVNRIDRESEAQDVFRRLSQSSKRFLGKEIEWLGGVKAEPATEMDEGPHLPSIVAAPESARAKAIKLIASRLVTAISARTTANVA